jgi:hypothetical protein
MLVLMVSLSALIGVNVGLVLGFLIFGHARLRPEPVLRDSLVLCTGQKAFTTERGA